MKIELGQRISTNTGFFEIIKIEGQSITVRFDDGYDVVATKGNVVKGSVRSPYAKTKFGIGFRGEGPHTMHNKLTYRKWSGMMTRCYDQQYSLDHPTYEGASCHEDWHNYQNFCEWAIEQVGFGVKGFDLDKDLLIPGNKQYGPDTCVFLPQELNKILGNTSPERGISTRPDLNGKWLARYNSVDGEIYLGCHEKQKALAIYQEYKLKYLKERALHWEAQIDPRAFKALMKYKF